GQERSRGRLGRAGRDHRRRGHRADRCRARGGSRFGRARDGPEAARAGALARGRRPRPRARPGRRPPAVALGGGPRGRQRGDRGVLRGQRPGDPGRGSGPHRRAGPGHGHRRRHG
ncbi:MAG: hypothetical protein AVDCRST_MAG35-1304, partial [uncultured Quadrisphaera sp.]